MRKGGARKMILNDHVVTIDVDWAPDWAIARVADIFIERNVKATWFITHESPETRKLFDHPNLFEIGLHPNFHEESTQGMDPMEVMTYLRRIAPSAVSLRTHGSVQSSRLLGMIREDFDILNDVSLFLPESPNLIPHEIFYSRDDKGLLRFPYFWEDDEEMYRPESIFSFENEKYHVPGLKIMCFHIIHIMLNSRTMTNYNECRKGKAVIDMSEDYLQPFVNKGKGTCTLFMEVVDFLSGNEETPSQTISDLARRWRDSG